ncbi:hypothetical protein [Pseudomonas sp. Marseille-QA0892]
MDRQAATPRVAGRAYLLSLLLGIAGAVSLFALTLTFLGHTGNLPPPAFSNSLCVDEKLKYLRDRGPAGDPNLLVIGSSVAWRHVDTGRLREQLPDIQPLNGAFCGLSAHQSTYVADWLIDREPSIRDVVMVVDPQDFTACSAKPAAVFDREDADDYVYEGAVQWRYYLRYFEPRSLVRNAIRVKHQRTDEHNWDPLIFTEYGDGPLNPEGDRGLHYAAANPLDDACFGALEAFARAQHAEGRKLLLVSTPLHPEWKRRYDPAGDLLSRFDQRLTAALQGTSGRYWNADRGWTVPEDAFVDAIHMRWPAAQQFSDALASNLGVSAPALRPVGNVADVARLTP